MDHVAPPNGNGHGGTGMRKIVVACERECGWQVTGARGASGQMEITEPWDGVQSCSAEERREQDHEMDSAVAAKGAAQDDDEVDELDEDADVEDVVDEDDEEGVRTMLGVVPNSAEATSASLAPTPTLLPITDSAPIDFGAVFPVRMQFATQEVFLGAYNKLAGEPDNIFQIRNSTASKLVLGCSGIKRKTSDHLCSLSVKFVIAPRRSVSGGADGEDEYSDDAEDVIEIRDGAVWVHSPDCPFRPGVVRLPRAPTVIKSVVGSPAPQATHIGKDGKEHTGKKRGRKSNAEKIREAVEAGLPPPVFATPAAQLGKKSASKAQASFQQTLASVSGQPATVAVFFPPHLASSSDATLAHIESVLYPPGSDGVIDTSMHTLAADLSQQGHLTQPQWELLNRAITGGPSAVQPQSGPGPRTLAARSPPPPASLDLSPRATLAEHEARDALITGEIDDFLGPAAVPVPMDPVDDKQPSTTLPNMLAQIRAALPPTPTKTLLSHPHPHQQPTANSSTSAAAYAPYAYRHPAPLPVIPRTRPWLSELSDRLHSLAPDTLLGEYAHVFVRVGIATPGDWDTIVRTQWDTHAMARTALAEEGLPQREFEGWVEGMRRRRERMAE
ncbi:hypothetical protein RQP46_010632 [Phenoliferia psychrophenolica]